MYEPVFTKCDGKTRLEWKYNVDFLQMAEGEWLAYVDSKDNEIEHNYWPWFYLLLAAIVGEI